METVSAKLPKFSFFEGPITNVCPKVNATIVDVYRGITGDYYKIKTEQLRAAKNEDQYRKAKKQLDFVTFAGIFRTRDKQNLIRSSEYCCIDFDHINPKYFFEIRDILKSDPIIETALLFVSPSGTGLKWIVEIDLEKYPDYEINFKGIVAYLRITSPGHFNCGENIIDTTGKDACRACFLCYDPEAYINPKYLYNESKIF